MKLEVAAAPPGEAATTSYVAVLDSGEAADWFAFYGFVGESVTLT